MVDDMRPYVVTCRTEGCHNAEHPITVYADVVDPGVACGPCGHLITDVVPVPS